MSSQPPPRRPLPHLDRRIAGLPGFVQFLLSLLLLITCALADHFTGNELSFSITYLIPTAFAAWYGGALAGYFLSFAASLVWLGVDLLSGDNYSHPMIPVWNCLVRLGFFLIVSALLLQIRKLLNRLQDLAGSDSLTGLANSRSFYFRLEIERERALRYHQPFTLAYLDLDNFKSVNDTFGHETGDRVLQTIATVIDRNLRTTDLAARIGGDEFAILLPQTAESDARDALLKLHGLLLDQMATDQWPVSCSLGAITCLDPSPFSSHDLVRQADDLMYQVKRSGKNRLELLSVP